MKKEKIVDIISNMSNKYNVYEIFCDWVIMLALSIQNACKIIHDYEWNEREERYMSIQKKYSKEELKIFTEMNDYLIEALEENMEDVLGYIFMKSGCGNKSTGQFFTPYHISYMMAGLVIDETKEKYVMNEPSCGGGGGIIAAARILKENGINYQKKLEVHAADLDFKSVCMTYIQLSLLGIDAIVEQKDSLSKEKSIYCFSTPMHCGVFV